ncbi:hypothetical protein [Candidatus Reidiella endopervernicosa]|uniref:Nuclear transport factor 2 family protein n=1 Tax=Candidatus Reidiella endopervernicosa TaxID=2738883 RepID=A0A6N0HTR8_9GAMM|nr:hypothetical protein [Candidatus Reidiella endopervernicosa]QKQ25784.1 hypothetical protein HUE57_05440 [Candidatus Reidiella endopervernicosa]
MALLFALTLTGCGSDPDSAETQIRAMIDRTEEAAEARELGTFRTILADEFNNRSGIDRKQAINLLRLQFFRNKRIHLLTRIKSLKIGENDDVAEMVLMVAMAGQPIGNLDALVNLRADLHRFDLLLMKIDDDWQIVEATWRRASSLEEMRSSGD